MLTPAVQEIITDAASSNAWKSRTPRRISRTGVDGSTPISIPIHSGISKTSTPDSSENSGSSNPIDISGTSTAPPAGNLRISGIGNKRKSASPNLRKSDKLDASIDEKFTNSLVAPPISTKGFGDKLSKRSSQDLYVHVGLQHVKDPVHPVTPQFVYHGLSTVDTLDKGAGI